MNNKIALSMSIGMLCAALCSPTYAGPIKPNKNSSAPRPAASGDLPYLNFQQSGDFQINYGYHGTSTMILSMDDPTRSLTITGISLTDPSTTITITANHCNNVVLTGSTTCTVDMDVYATNQQYDMTGAQFAVATNEGTTGFELEFYTPAADLIYTPMTLDFGNQSLFVDATKTIKVTNPNPLPRDLDEDPEGQGFGSADGALRSNIGVCVHIEANSSCLVTFTFKPVALGQDASTWFAPRNSSTDNYETYALTVEGTGVQSAVPVDLSNKFNVMAYIHGSGNTPIKSGGMDGLGNVYSYIDQESWLHQGFTLASPGLLNAVANQTIIVSAGNYAGVSLLGAAVFGPQLNRTFTLTYMDGTSTTVSQNFSDWKTPQHYLNEGIAQAFPYRLEADATTQHPGPYYLYGYTLPVDPTKQLASIKLPSTRDVVIIAMNLVPTPLPVAVNLAPYYNVAAMNADGTKGLAGGIDGQGDTISYPQLSTAPETEGSVLLALGPANAPDAVANATVALPAGKFSSLHLLGMGVNGQRPNRTLVVQYTDGTRVNIQQTFSDWHYLINDAYLHADNNVAQESNALEMPYRLNYDGSQHAGPYMVYEYTLPLDPTRTVASVQLPNDKYVVILSMSLQP